MPVPEPVHEIQAGPVRVAVLAHARGRPAEPSARAWIEPRLALPAGALPRDARGRPSTGSDEADVNWSHSGDWLAVALGRDVRVGVDIEVLRARRDPLALAGRYFHPAEAAALAALSPAQRAPAFLRLWCAKEAVLKAHGHGLAFGLDRLRFDGIGGELQLVAVDQALGARNAWSVQSFDWSAGVGAVAWCAGS